MAVLSNTNNFDFSTSSNATRTADEMAIRGANNLIYAQNNPTNTAYAQALTQMSDAFSGVPGSTYLQQKYANYVNKQNGLNGNTSQTPWSDYLGAFGLGLSALSGIGNYLNGKKYLALARENMQNQMNIWNETYNNQLKQYNTALADRLRARAAFETGDSTAYNEEITNNSMSRGHTTAASSDYLNYKRSSNADNPYSKKETNPDQ